jgi:phosphate/sulfate permease
VILTLLLPEMWGGIKLLVKWVDFTSLLPQAEPDIVFTGGRGATVGCGTVTLGPRVIQTRGKKLVRLPEYLKFFAAGPPD